MNTSNERDVNFENKYVIKEEDECDICGKNIYYSVVYDAYFCTFCDRWLENACEDPRCEFCSKRPKKPSELSGGI